MTAVDWLITPAGSNMLCAVSAAEERQACQVTESGFCIDVALAWAADTRTVQVVVLTLYEMECVKPLNPTQYYQGIWLSLAICPDIFLFISHDSSLILVEYLVHWVLRRDIRSRRSSINSASAKELSTVRYLLPGLPEFVASVLLLVVGLWARPEVWSYNQFAGDCKFKYE